MNKQSKYFYWIITMPCDIFDVPEDEQFDLYCVGTCGNGHGWLDPMPGEAARDAAWGSEKEEAERFATYAEAIAFCREYRISLASIKIEEVIQWPH